MIRNDFICSMNIFSLFIDPTIMNNLIELKPPKTVYPQGNVGTPTSYFLNEINACRLPSTIISKY